MVGAIWPDFPVLRFGIFALMLTEISFALKLGYTPRYDLLFGLINVCIVIALILWGRLYRRKWQQRRGEGWPQVEGIFVPGEGEVVTMRRGSSKTIAGYEAWLYYEYQCDGERDGIYTRFFPTKPEAQAFLKILEGQKVPVRVKPGKPSKSCVLDRDVELRTGPLEKLGSPSSGPQNP
jgi:hypothetical protein